MGNIKKGAELDLATLMVHQNLEQQYSVMLLAKAACDVFKLYDAGELPRVPADPILFNLAVTTLQICVRTLSSQDDTGAWKNSCEVSAYAILTLKTLASLPWIRAIIGDEVNRSISSGELFLKAREIEWENPAPIWIEKVSYGSKLLSETYCLAALQATATYTWGGKVAALTKTSMNKVIKFSEFFSRLPLFSDEPFWRLRASVAEGYMMASTLDDPRARSIFPQAKGAVRSKYLDYIPLAWTTCNNANNFGISTQTMREMMIISLLNFQADKYIEDVIANRNLASDIPALQGVIRHILPQDSFDFSSPVYRPNYQQLPDLPLKAHHQNGGYINGGQAPRSLQLFTGEASDSYAHFKFLSDFNDTMHRFVSYIQDHTAVSGSSWSSRRRVTDQLRNFLHAHIKQGEDNLELVRRISGQEKNIILADARTTFYDWVNSTSADHTSCPYSFQFFQCLIAPAAGQSCFEGVLATYIGQDLCRHLASMCRIYNDYGSILRDRKERNLNSVNFSEFHDHSETLHNNGMNCTFATTDEVLRQKLMQVATYERSGLDSAMERLKPKISMKTWKAIQVFVNVTDLFGQVYVVRDINDG
jgi:hypothetical protein